MLRLRMSISDEACLYHMTMSKMAEKSTKKCNACFELKKEHLQVDCAIHVVQKTRCDVKCS